jgi:hypothetical protein
MYNLKYWSKFFAHGFKILFSNVLGALLKTLDKKGFYVISPYFKTFL